MFIIGLLIAFENINAQTVSIPNETKNKIFLRKVGINPLIDLQRTSVVLEINEIK